MRTASGDVATSSSRHQRNHHQKVDSQPWLQKVIRSEQVANSSQCKANLTSSETCCYRWWRDVTVGGEMNVKQLDEGILSCCYKLSNYLSN